MKKIISILIAVVMLIASVICFSGCSWREGDIYESEYYIYQLNYRRDDIYIIGLTDKGKEQEYLVIPKTIEGKIVNSIRNAQYDTRETKEKYGDLRNINYRSDKLKKVFIVSPIDVIVGWLSSKIFNDYNNPFFEGAFYIPNEINKPIYGFYRTSIIGYSDPANVSYYYNYKNAPNDGFYWIDNYDYGDKIEYKPEEPKREGYTFGGWFKESECVNIWDYQLDTLPQAQYNENNQEIYQETKLFAKWIKN